MKIAWPYSINHFQQSALASPGASAVSAVQSGVSALDPMHESNKARSTAAPACPDRLPGSGAGAGALDGGLEGSLGAFVERVFCD